ncbi:8116_t:CDS:2 [Paraglomus occultum]|uniref:8116_t:CDS:1 n=1 Tax=Paraglomus occultum TaxID=144539 RepID=A0A9N9FT33_9GLOM|nr:8116_t:CDS:2 [Paraglomus occultum]
MSNIHRRNAVGDSLLSSTPSTNSIIASSTHASSLAQTDQNKGTGSDTEPNAGSFSSLKTRFEQLSQQPASTSLVDQTSDSQSYEYGTTRKTPISKVASAINTLNSLQRQNQQTSRTTTPPPPSTQAVAGSTLQNTSNLLTPANHLENVKSPSLTPSQHVNIVAPKPLASHSTNKMPPQKTPTLPPRPQTADSVTRQIVNPFEDPFADENDVDQHGTEDNHEDIYVNGLYNRSFSEKHHRLQRPAPLPIESSLSPSRVAGTLSSPFGDDAVIDVHERPASRTSSKPSLPTKPPRSAETLIELDEKHSSRHSSRHNRSKSDIKPALPPRPSTRAVSNNEKKDDRSISFHKTAHQSSEKLHRPPALPQRADPENYRAKSRLTVASSQSRRDHSGSDLSDESSSPNVPLGGLGKPDSSHVNRWAPRFNDVKDINPKNKHTPKSFAISGDLVVTDGSSSMRIWKLQTGENVRSISHDQSKVTASVFKPTRQIEDIGRYLWCGTSDGTLFVVDVSMSTVIETTSKAHDHSVNFILVHNRQLWTIDDNGRLNIWSETNQNEPTLKSTPRSLSVANKQTCALIADNDLWMGAGKSIEVYSFAGGQSGSNMVSQVMDVGFELGGVTCMTQTNDASLVYVGHENGMMTIWNAQTKDKLSVVQASIYCITCLLGVGDYLWAGYKTGKIYIYDVKNKDSWVVLKEWQAHKSPVIDMKLDEDALWRLDRLQVGSLSDEGQVSVWDGLLRSDWLTNQMALHEQEYCTYRNITILICSWNIDASKPPDLEKYADDAKFLRLWFTSASSPEIIVIGFQEIIDLESKKMTAKTMLMSKKKADKQMNENITQRYRLWRDRLVKAVREYSSAKYTLKVSENLVGLFSLIFIKESEEKSLKDICVKKCKTGLGGYHGNKGAIAMRFVYDDSSVCFVNCHLAAGQTNVTARNNDAQKILESIELESLANDLDRNTRNEYGQVFVDGGNGSMITDHEICFFSGDLNYRIDVPREVAINKINNEDFDYLLEHDQLIKQRIKNPGFRLKSFSEGRITFAPTYKYNPGEDVYDTSEKKRTPAWCDRILYRGKWIKLLNYQRYECKVSDHRPISGTFQAKIKTIRKEVRAEVEDEIKGQWKEYLEEEKKAKKLLWLVRAGCDIEEARKALREGRGNMHKAINRLNKSNSR